MYCVNCGVSLADSEKTCPLCGTQVFHPEIAPPEGKPLFPAREPVFPFENTGGLIIVTTLFLMAIFIALLCDLQITGGITWSGFAVGAVLLAYELLVLPCWFRDPNPVVFVPCGFAAIGIYLLYVDLATGGNWFLSFAFPVTGLVGAIVTAMAALFRYLRRGRLFCLGGGLIAFGLAMPLVEFLLVITFRLRGMFVWSLYPLVVLCLFGGMLIFLAAFRPARESMERKLFL